MTRGCRHWISCATKKIRKKQNMAFFETKANLKFLRDENYRLHQELGEFKRYFDAKLKRKEDEMKVVQEENALYRSFLEEFMCKFCRLNRVISQHQQEKELEKEMEENNFVHYACTVLKKNCKENKFDVIATLQRLFQNQYYDRKQSLAYYREILSQIEKNLVRKKLVGLSQVVQQLSEREKLSIFFVFEYKLSFVDLDEKSRRLVG